MLWNFTAPCNNMEFVSLVKMSDTHKLRACESRGVREWWWYFVLKGEIKQAEDEGEADGDGGEEVGGLFRVASRKQLQQQEQKDLMNAEDCAKFVVKQVRDWMQSDVSDSYVIYSIYLHNECIHMD